MNRKEFLDILRDYLKKDFSEDEINDIIRDYEEYFVNGEIEGKSDLETIAALGSPKLIVRDLTNQTKDDESKINKKDKIEDIFIKYKRKMKEYCFKFKDFLDEKLTPSLNNNNSLSNKGVRVILTLLSLVLIVPAFMVVCFMAFIAGMLSLSLITFFIAIPLMISFSWSAPQIAFFFIFLSIAFIGFQILAWQIFIFIVKYMKKTYKTYNHWIKTRKIYINANESKGNINMEEDKGGRDNE
ncbi:DUF1700 domain-containing protein [Terrisporobacter mayombei]|uniref:DUF1700 domain-containing protein n=1 Tax=Terrisporobacter mayombei TaxID=1541 RepID=A0ABY9Q090_9FIRM|nr:DUF1700 domain-containing protein [Terrisporobacter mayombei]MCC3867123.1 DUF1700 domain-containing protein [Terrisporobacter mayombei]WMT81383.1 hypothetical protein TEMA_17230 [Terrisporobacter mayombei]